MAIIKKSTNNKIWGGCKEDRILLPYQWECKLIQPLWRTVRRFLKALKIELPYDPAIQLLGIYLETTIIQEDICTPSVHDSTIYNSKPGNSVNVHRGIMDKDVVQFSSAESLGCVPLSVDPWTAAHQASLSIANTRAYSNSCPSCQ